MIPRRLDTAAAYSWRLLVIAGAVALTTVVLAELRLVVLPVVVALFATAALRPLSVFLTDRGAPPALAAFSVVGGALLALVALAALIVPPFVDQIDELGRSVRAGIAQVSEWLLEGPADLSQRELDSQLDRALDRVRDNSGALVSGLVSGALVLAEVIVGLLLAVVITFFFLKDGDRIWEWLVGTFPHNRREDVREAGRRVWSTLGGYLRGVTIVALFDSLFIGLALVVVGVPAALPLAVLTFFGAYIPIAGAFVTGLAAVLVALVAQGLSGAIVIAVAVIAVQQIESNFLQPVVVGRAVQVHPVAILLAVMAGGVTAGIIGALIAVPLTAVVARVAGYLSEAAPPEAGPAARSRCT